MADELMGDTLPADAGQEQPDQTELPGQDEEGETAPADAGQGAEGEGAEDDLAFKKRLEREIPKIEERIRAEYEQRYRAYQPQVQDPQATIETIADQLGI